MKKTFLGKNINLYAFCKELEMFSNFPKKYVIFQEKSKFWTFWEILHFQWEFYGKFATFWWKKFTVRKCPKQSKSDIINWQTA